MGCLIDQYSHSLVSSTLLRDSKNPSRDRDSLLETRRRVHQRPSEFLDVFPRAYDSESSYGSENGLPGSEGAGGRRASSCEGAEEEEEVGGGKFDSNLIGFELGVEWSCLE